MGSPESIGLFVASVARVGDIARILCIHRDAKYVQTVAVSRPNEAFSGGPARRGNDASQYVNYVT
jgi:hypothetical protein